MVIKRTIKLRKADVYDVEKLVSWAEEEDFFSTIFQGCEASRESRLKHMSRKLAEMARAFSTSKLYLVDSDHYKNIGTIYFHSINWKNQYLVIEDYIDKEFQGSPVVVNIMAAACDFAFFELNMNKILAYVNGGNQRALDFARQFDHLEAVLKQYISSHGRTSDLYIYAEYREERIREKALEANHPYVKKLLSKGLISREIYQSGYHSMLDERERIFAIILAQFRATYQLDFTGDAFTSEEIVMIDRL